MKKDISIDESIYKGLQALSNSSFPKKCMNCGRFYETAEDYIKKTEPIRKSTGLKESIDDDDRPIVELFRNCVCGSTLMDIFNNRRDLSQRGIKRRQKFEEILDRLTAAGYSKEVAREELLKIMRGEESDILKVKKNT